MITPRVTVPVDAVELLKRHMPMLEAAASPAKSEVFVVCGHEAREMHDAIARLSAAPAPEGGAVEEAAARLHETAYRDTAIAATVQTSDLRTVLATLATREEAPAEAGEPMTEAEVRQWIEACNHEPARQVLRDYLALRAQPQAREEAQPVGYCDPTHLTRIKREAEARGEASSVIYGYPAGTYRTPLYTTPPAPEAEKLRVAVEALEKIKANPEANCLSVERWASQALAALQQEGR